MKFLRKNGLYLAWVVTLLGLVISLYVGEFLRVEPCHLCWYQRIALYPLVLLLGIAAYKNESQIIPYAIPLALLGGAIAFYQVLGQNLPFLLTKATCGLAYECGTPIFTLFGFFTFPTLSAIGFASIASLLYLAKKN